MPGKPRVRVKAWGVFRTDEPVRIPIHVATKELVAKLWADLEHEKEVAVLPITIEYTIPRPAAGRRG